METEAQPMSIRVRLSEPKSFDRVKSVKQMCPASSNKILFGFKFL